MMRFAIAVLLTVTGLAPLPTGAGSGAQGGGDSVSLLAVTPGSGMHLDRGQPVPFEVEIQYTLNSRDSAQLSLSLAQFRAADACGIGPDELVVADEATIRRGSGTVRMHMTWPGDTGYQTKGRVYGAGSISFSAAMWRSHLYGRFFMQEFSDSYCSHF